MAHSRGMQVSNRSGRSAPQGATFPASGRRVGRSVRASHLVSLPLLVLLLPSLSLAKGMTPNEEALVKAPRAIVEVTIGKVLAVLADESLDTTARRSKIEGIAFEVFDFTTMSKLVLARNWKKFDKDQRKEFVQEFKQHLSRNYGSRLDRYRQTDVKIVGTRIEPRNDVTVRSKVVGGQFDGIEMNYRMRQKTGDAWRVVDVVIEGVSLVANFRSQFVEILSNGGPPELLRQMKTKNFDKEPE